MLGRSSFCDIRQIRVVLVLRYISPLATSRSRSGPARGPQRVSMRGGDGVPWPAAGADFLEFFSFFAIFYLFSWEFGVLAAMLSRLATACRRS